MAIDMRWSNIIQVGKFNLFIKIVAWRKGSVRTRGYSSRVIPTCLHVLFLDYDNITDDRLKQELTFLQDLYELGDVYVFKTYEYGRHCICIDALTAREQYEIVCLSSCDQAFKHAIQISELRCWVLRFMKKGDRDAPHYAYIIKSLYKGKNPQSVGHKMFLEKMFGIKIPKLKNPIGEEAIEIQEYNTWSKVSKDELEKLVKQEKRRDRSGRKK